MLIIDDGSTDRTIEVAEEHGVTHFVRHARNRGLGRSFHDGVQRALELGADIVVNTDGDNQYPQERIADLVQPIIAGKADIVIADRQVHLVEHFSGPKVLLQKLGSRIVNKAAGTDLPDAASGFRAYSRDTLMLLNTITRFSYCMETIIQAGNKKLAITSVPGAHQPQDPRVAAVQEHLPARAQERRRDHPRLHHVQAVRDLQRLRGAVRRARPDPFVRYAILQLEDNSGSHLQSLLVGAVLLVMSFLSVIVGIIGDLLRTNRALIEDTLEHTKKMRFGMLSPADTAPVDVSERAVGRSRTRRAGCRADSRVTGQPASRG